jgi:hypothetical protein
VLQESINPKQRSQVGAENDGSVVDRQQHSLSGDADLRVLEYSSCAQWISL